MTKTEVEVIKFEMETAFVAFKLTEPQFITAGDRSQKGVIGCTFFVTLDQPTLVNFSMMLLQPMMEQKMPKNLCLQFLPGGSV